MNKMVKEQLCCSFAVLSSLSDGEKSMQDFTALDVETTGLNPKSEKIIEVGAVKVRNGRIVDRYESLIYPGKKLEERIVELTGITDEMLKEAPLPEKVIPELLEFIGEDVLLGHSVLFDYSFLKRAAVNLGLMKSKDIGCGIDTLRIARCCLRELESRSLPFLCQYFEIPHKAHRAIHDAEATIMLYEKLLEKFGDIQESGIFEPFELIYQIKREGPANKAQKERLYLLVQKHKLVIEYDIDRLTRNEASRMIDKIILKHGR